MIMYRVDWTGEIITKEVHRKTEKFVIFNHASREAIRSQFANWFDSLNEAVEYAVAKAESRVRVAENQLRNAEIDRVRITTRCEILLHETKKEEPSND